MNQNKFLFIYHRREILIFLIMITMSCIFAFTLGVHLSKEITPLKPTIALEQAPPLVSTLSDQTPNPQELTAPGENAQASLDQRLSSELKKEALESPVRLDHPRQLKLPSQTKSTHGGATTLKFAQKSLTSPDRLSYSLQVGSYPSLKEAKHQFSALNQSELKPDLREVEIEGKGKWYRIYLGHFSDRKAAELAGQTYRSQNKISSYIVTQSQN